MSSTQTSQEITFASVMDSLSPEQKKVLLANLTKKPTKTQKQTPHSLFKENCHEDYEEPQIRGWTQCEAGYGGVYASGLVLTKKFRSEICGFRFSGYAELHEKMPKRHFLTLESAVEFAELLNDGENPHNCPAITKTTAGYELRKWRCAIKNTPSGFNSGLRTWLRDCPTQTEDPTKTYASLSTCLDAHTLVRTPAQAKKIHIHNEEAVADFLDLEAEEEEVVSDTEEEEEPQDTPLDRLNEAVDNKMIEKYGTTEEVVRDPEALDEDRFSVGGFSMTNPDADLTWDFLDALAENDVEITELEEKIIRLHLGAGTSGPTEYWDCVESDATEMDSETTDFIVAMYQDIPKDEKFCRIWRPACEEVVRFNVEEDMESYMIRQF